jgi:putative flippase GtrA
MILVRKLLRYAAVSAISTVVSLTILGVLVESRTTTPAWANVIATGVATIPSFELNRRWVWGKVGRRSVWAEMGPFLVWCFSEMALSTIVVNAASRWAVASRLGLDARTLVAVAANVATFGSLWVAQFAILDRLLFRAPEVGANSVGADDDDGGSNSSDGGYPPVGWRWRPNGAQAWESA